MKRSVFFGRKGFSLTEVLVGLIFLAVGLLAIASLQIASVRGNFFSSNLMQATYTGQDRLEFLKSLPLTDDRLTPGIHNDGTFKLQDSDLTFSRSYSVERDPNGIKITYLVRWNDGTDHQISFSTIRSK